MKHCQKMKWRQRACLDSMGNKCDMAQRCGDIGRTRDGSRGETMVVGLTQILLSRKIKKSMRSIQLLQIDSEYLKQ
jgi:hypothetical protein